VNNPDLHWLYVMGRINPGAGIKAMEARMQVRTAAMAATGRAFWGRPQRPRFRGRRSSSRGGSGIGLMRATYSALISCVNYTSLF